MNDGIGVGACGNRSCGFQAAVDGALSVHGCGSVHAVVELREDVRDLHHLTGHYPGGILTVSELITAHRCAKRDRYTGLMPVPP